MNQVVFFNQKNKWNLEVKTNFENFDFQALITHTFAFILMKTHNFQTSNMNLHSEMYSGNSEAPLPPDLQNWTKSHSFHDSGLSGQLSFGWASWKSLGLNYSTVGVLKVRCVDLIQFCKYAKRGDSEGISINCFKFSHFKA